MEMVNGGIKKTKLFFMIILFCLATPIGIIIGMVITYHAGDGGYINTGVIGVLQAIAGGTLLYITFYEVLDREKLSKFGMTGFIGCLLITSGFLCMAGIEAIGT